MSRPGYVDKRGSAKTRRRRREWMMEHFDPDLGPERVRCHLKLSAFCELVVTLGSLSVDRLIMGGSYRRDNIQPACKPCQDRQGGLAAVATMDALLTEYRYTRERWEVRFDVETGHTYYPGIIDVERRRERRGGRREITDWLNDNPPPVFAEWLVEWHASRREPCEAAAGDADSASAV